MIWIVIVLNVLMVILLLKDHVWFLVHPTVIKVTAIQSLVSAQAVLLDLLSTLQPINVLHAISPTVFCAVQIMSAHNVRVLLSLQFKLTSSIQLF